MKRDLYIDFAKGLATISVIFIHTVFWSGQFYVPSEIRILSLLFDVVLFYALSGLTSGGDLDKTFYRLIKLQITYMIFVTFLFFVDYFFKVFGLSFFGMDWMKHFYSTYGGKYVPQNISMQPQWQNLGNWYLHQYTNCDTFPVIMGSFWYLKVYFILAVFGALIIRFFPHHIHWFTGLCFGLTLFFNVFPQYYPTGQVGYVAFYLGVFLLGHQLKGKKIPNKQVPLLYLGVALALIWMFSYYGPDIFYKLNKLKFPPKLPYIIWISFAVVTLFVGYNRLKITKNYFVNSIGKNAIFYYFGQGISSSLIYFLVAPLKDEIQWWVLLPVIFGINLFMAILLSGFLKKLDEFGWRMLEIFRKKTADKG